jgi:hypothetical protein
MKESSQKIAVDGTTKRGAPYATPPAVSIMICQQTSSESQDFH